MFDYDFFLLLQARGDDIVGTNATSPSWNWTASAASVKSIDKAERWPQGDSFKSCGQVNAMCGLTSGAGAKRDAIGSDPHISSIDFAAYFAHGRSRQTKGSIWFVSGR